MAIVPNGDKLLPAYLDLHIPSKLELCGAGSSYQVIPSNTTNAPFKSLVAETAGDVAIVGYNDAVSVITVAAGQTVPVYGKRVNATGTTATLIGIK